MKISKHWLQASQPGDDAFLLPPQPTPNHGGSITPLYLLMHYTASTTLAAATSWFLNPAAQASAHVVIDRDGHMVQMVPFNLRAWHAGKSQWGELIGLNDFSIGIELVNAGKLSQGHDGNWYSYSGQLIPPDQVGIATHPDETAACGWQRYTNAQLEQAASLGVLLRDQYGLQDVLSHEQVSRGRKVDTGPLFPLSSFRGRIMGRKD